jgi:hypothetical protein
MGAAAVELHYNCCHSPAPAAAAAAGTWSAAPVHAPSQCSLPGSFMCSPWLQQFSCCCCCAFMLSLLLLLLLPLLLLAFMC